MPREEYKTALIKAHQRKYSSVIFTAGLEGFDWRDLVKNRFVSVGLWRKTWATILMKVSGKTHISLPILHPCGRAGNSLSTFTAEINKILGRQNSCSQCGLAPAKDWSQVGVLLPYNRQVPHHGVDINAKGNFRELVRGVRAWKPSHCSAMYFKQELGFAPFSSPAGSVSVGISSQANT